MKKFIALIFLTAVVCGTGMADARADRPSRNAVTKNFDLKGFDGIESSAGIDVYITVGDKYEVTVTADPKTMQHINIRVKGDMLHVGYEKSRNSRNREADVFVTMPRVKILSASSGSDIKAKSILKGKSLTISASSGADIEATVDYESVSVACSSGADVKLKGEAKNCSATCSSGADIDLGGLRCINVAASASSAADIEVFAVDKLAASASSGADIRYRGTPKSVTINKSSGGSVRMD